MRSLARPWVLVVPSVAGLLATPPELTRSCRATRLPELLRLPFAVPFVFAGLKVAMALWGYGQWLPSLSAPRRGWAA